MSNEALTWAFKQDLPMTQKFVLVALADYADEQQSCFPSHLHTAQRVGTSRSTVKRALAELTEKGYIKVEPRSNGKQHRSNRYVLKVDKTTPVQDDPGPQETGGRPTVTPPPAHSEPGVGSPVSHYPLLNPQGTPKGTSSADAADEQSPAEDPERREDVEQVCNLLADCIEANGSKRPTITKKWRTEARLLIDRDERTPRQIEWLIRWCQRDSFWKSRILSMPKLREKFDQLRLQAIQDSQPRVSKRERENLAFLNGGQPPARSWLTGGTGWEDPRDVPGQRALPIVGEVES